MALPTSRDEFKEYCLRALGKPVIEINVDEDQVDDRVSDALQYYWDYHFDGTEKIYYKHQIVSNNYPDRIYSLSLDAGGTLYSNSDTVVFTGGGGSNASANIVTHANGTIASVSLSNNGVDFVSAPTVTVQTSTGSGAQITAELGGFITLPENIIGAINIFPTGSALGLGDMFNVNYQLAMSDMYNYTNFTLIPYYITRTHLSLIEQMLSGQKPVRYNRNRNRFYIDMAWRNFPEDQFVVIEAYEIVDPDDFTDVWKDRWLIKYATALIKKQWGANLKKFIGMQMPGGIQFNGQATWDEANEEILRLEQEMLDMTLPPMDMIG